MVHLELTYNEIDKNIDNIWSVLFTTGYLTKVGEVKLPDSENYALKLVIPNKEVREVFYSADTGMVQGSCSKGQ
mgnify:CR=1 FL=1